MTTEAQAPAAIESNGVRKAPTHIPEGVSIFKKDAAPAVAAEGEPVVEAAPPETPATAPAEAPDKKADSQRRRDELRALASKQKEHFDATMALKAERERTAQLEAQAKQTTAQLEARLKAAEDRLAAAEKDPLAYLDSRGIKAKAIAERIAKGDDPLGELRTRVEAAEKALEEERKALKQREENAQRLEQEAAVRRQWEAAKDALVQTWQSGKDKYPTLHRTIDSREEFVHEFLTFNQYLRSHPDVPSNVRAAANAGAYTDAEVLDALESRFAKRYGKATQGAPGAPVVPSGSTTPAGEQAKPQAKPKAPTLTTRQASSANATKTPKAISKLSHKESIGAMADMYRALKSTPSAAK
jgi:hypothetical protein